LESNSVKALKVQIVLGILFAGIANSCNSSRQNPFHNCEHTIISVTCCTQEEPTIMTLNTCEIFDSIENAGLVIFGPGHFFYLHDTVSGIQDTIGTDWEYIGPIGSTYYRWKGSSGMNIMNQYELIRSGVEK